MYMWLLRINTVKLVLVDCLIKCKINDLIVGGNILKIVAFIQ